MINDTALRDLMHRVESLEETLMQQPRSGNVILEVCLQARISLCETFKSMISDTYFSLYLNNMYSEGREQNTRKKDNEHD